MKRMLFISVSFMLIASLCVAAGGVKRKRLRPHQYGSVQLDNYSSQTGQMPVVFDHWVHRSRFTCRLCHVDLGFAMEAGETEVRAIDNQRGYYCGTCHDGRRRFEGQALFRACSVEGGAANSPQCAKCHGDKLQQEKEETFYRLRAALPKERFGNGIDWEAAEKKGLISPVDYLKGVSIRRASLAVQQDFALDAKLEGMPDILFSHRKHTVWNGCEVCHPEIFMGVKKGATRYTMIDLFQGKYCGVCHDTVAFPQMDCQRCHVKPVA